MILSTQTDTLGKVFGDAEAIKIIAGSGFDAFDYSMFGMTDPEHRLNKPGRIEYVKELRRIADDAGIVCNQAHAPFPSHRIGDDTYNAHIPDAIKRSIEHMAILGGKVIVVHPITILEDAKAQAEINLELYTQLIPTLREYGVKAALENMFSWSKDRAAHAACSTPEQFCEYLDALPSDCFTACLDIGHSGLVGINAADMITSLGHDRLLALHVHDNDKHYDLHTLPFTMSLDWKAITAALAKIDYAGDFTFEADNFLNKMPTELMRSGSRFMQDTGRVLISMIENAKNG